MANAIESIKSCGLDKILGVRDSIGANLHDVFIITRCWSGEEIGDGRVKESKLQVKPTPRIKDFSHNLRVTEGGSVKQGDLLLKGISKSKFPERRSIDLCSDDDLVEKFYEIDCNLYRVISVVEKHLTWNVQVRRLSNQERNTS